MTKPSTMYTDQYAEVRRKLIAPHWSPQPPWEYRREMPDGEPLNLGPMAKDSIGKFNLAWLSLGWWYPSDMKQDRLALRNAISWTFTPLDGYKVLGQPLELLASMLPMQGFRAALRDSAAFGKGSLPMHIANRLTKPTPFDND